MTTVRSVPDVLVLGAGGTLGIAWLRGVLAGIEQAGELDFRDCEYFVGTSAGSVVATALAAGVRPTASVAPDVPDAAAMQGDPEASEAVAGLRIARAATTRALASAGRLAQAATLPLAPLALAAGAPGGRVARAAVFRTVPHTGRRPTELGRFVEALGARFDGRLRVTALDRRRGRRVVFGAPGEPVADVRRAVLASCAVPWLFDPVHIDGREYIDGGCWSPTNLDAAPAGRGTEVLCLMPTVASGALRTVTRASAGTEAQALRARGAKVKLIAPDAGSIRAMGPRLMDERRTAESERAGFEQGLRLGRAAEPGPAVRDKGP